jgi:nucleotide-binding universal stress UspA family protein
MYKHILIPLENSESDRTILEHIRPLARLTGARLTLVHVADGWAARHYDELNLKASEEIKNDRAYLDQVADELRKDGFQVEAVLAMGNPADEIMKMVDDRGCDLIAMSTHGHGFFIDLLSGNTAHNVRHRATVPVLLLKAPPSSASKG